MIILSWTISFKRKKLPCFLLVHLEFICILRHSSIIELKKNVFLWLNFENYIKFFSNINISVYKIISITRIVFKIPNGWAGTRLQNQNPTQVLKKTARKQTNLITMHPFGDLSQVPFLNLEQEPTLNLILDQLNLYLINLGSKLQKICMSLPFAIRQVKPSNQSQVSYLPANHRAPWWKGAVKKKF